MIIVTICKKWQFRLRFSNFLCFSQTALVRDIDFSFFLFKLLQLILKVLSSLFLCLYIYIYIYIYIYLYKLTKIASRKSSTKVSPYRIIRKVFSFLLTTDCVSLDFFSRGGRGWPFLSFWPIIFSFSPGRWFEILLSLPGGFFFWYSECW